MINHLKLLIFSFKNTPFYCTCTHFMHMQEPNFQKKNLYSSEKEMPGNKFFNSFV